MKLAKFAFLCMELGATRPPIPVLLSSQCMIFSDTKEATAAGELIQMDFPDCKFRTVDSYLQLLNPTDK